MIKSLQKWPVKRSILLAALIGFMTVVGMLRLNGEATVSASQQGAVVSFVLPNEAYIGELVTVKLVANNAQNLAGFQATISYDQNNLGGGAYTESGLEQGGRNIMLLKTIQREGSIVLGLVTCPVADCGDSYARRTRQQPRGVDGRVELATLELYTDVPGLYELKLENVKLVDPQGNPLVVSTDDAVLVIRTR